ncbi:hypothetical protein ACFL5G_02785 [Candidatus Margulisiibacteriota bacterium]
MYTKIISDVFSSGAVSRKLALEQIYYKKILEDGQALQRSFQLELEDFLENIVDKKIEALKGLKVKVHPELTDKDIYTLAMAEVPAGDYQEITQITSIRQGSLKVVGKNGTLTTYNLQQELLDLLKRYQIININESITLKEQHDKVFDLVKGLVIKEIPDPSSANEHLFRIINMAEPGKKSKLQDRDPQQRKLMANIDLADHFRGKQLDIMSKEILVSLILKKFPDLDLKGRYRVAFSFTDIILLDQDLEEIFYIPADALMEYPIDLKKIERVLKKSTKTFELLERVLENRKISSDKKLRIVSKNELTAKDHREEIGKDHMAANLTAAEKITLKAMLQFFPERLHKYFKVISKKNSRNLDNKKYLKKLLDILFGQIDHYDPISFEKEKKRLVVEKGLMNIWADLADTAKQYFFARCLAVSVLKPIKFKDRTSGPYQILIDNYTKHFAAKINPARQRYLEAIGQGKMGEAKEKAEHAIHVKFVKYIQKIIYSEAPKDAEEGMNAVENALISGARNLVLGDQDILLFRQMLQAEYPELLE